MMLHHIILHLTTFFSLSYASTIRGVPIESSNSEELSSNARRSRHLAPERNRIVGGTQVDIKNYPHVVSLQYKHDIPRTWSGHFCGGALIAQDVVLTAAHCLFGEQTQSYTVVVGRTDISSEQFGQEYSVKSQMIHPIYNDETVVYDIALLFLERPVKDNVALAEVNEFNYIPSVGKVATALGWGYEDEYGVGSTELKAVDLNVISNQKCDESRGEVYDSLWNDMLNLTYKNTISEDMLCAKSRLGAPCTADSGGPLVIKGNPSTNVPDIVVGVVSHSIGCDNPSFPVVFSRVSKAYGWIKKQVCTKSVAPPEGICDWITLVQEDFVSGYGIFNDGGTNVIYYKSIKDRLGIVGIQGGNGKQATLYSDKLLFNRYYTKFKVTFSFFTQRMERNDMFCLDYSINDGDTWVKSKCWISGTDIQNGLWYDGKSVVFSPPVRSSSLNIQFRGNSNSVQDNTYIDKIRILGIQT